MNSYPRQSQVPSLISTHFFELGRVDHGEGKLGELISYNACHDPIGIVCLASCSNPADFCIIEKPYITRVVGVRGKWALLIKHGINSEEAGVQKRAVMKVNANVLI